MGDRIVVTGIGVVSALGIGKETLWNGAIRGQTTIQTVDLWSMPDIGAQFIAKVPTFSRKDFLPNLRPPFPSRYCQMAMVATGLALQDARINTATIDPTRIGTLLSTDYGPNETVEQYLVDLFMEGPQAVRPLRFANSVSNVALGSVARYYQLKGASSMVLGENSLCYAYDLLQDEKADLMLCGGVDELQDLIVWSHNKLGLLAHPPMDANIASQPYLGQSTGMVLGEAAAVVVLERLDHAKKRNAPIYAEMLGYATRADSSANHILSARTSKDLADVMQAALDDAGVSSSEIGFVLGCASSHPNLSQVELKALAQIWSDCHIKVTSIKGLIGETFGSAGVLSLSIAALSLSQSIIPMCGLLSVPSNDYVEVVSQNACPTKAQFCICNSIHIGGNNTSIVLAAFPRGVMSNEY